MTSGYSCGPTEALMRPLLRASDGPFYCPTIPQPGCIITVKVKTIFFTLLVLPAVAFAQAPGRLFIHMAGGYEVVVDGTSMGLTSNDIGGRSIELPAGVHRVVVRSRDG